MTTLYGNTLSFAACGNTIVNATHESITLYSVPGVGANRSLVVTLVDAGAAGAFPPITSNPLQFSYSPPTVTTFIPSSRVDLTPAANVPLDRLEIAGTSFGDYDAATAQGWSAAERNVTGVIGTSPCFAPLSGGAYGNMDRFSVDGVTILSCGLNVATTVAGYNTVGITVAGQSSVMPANASGALLVVCALGAFGRLGETCALCPPGATCPGFLADSSLPWATRFSYPVASPGWYNLNSSDTVTRGMAAKCPKGSGVPGRDVCIVPCQNPFACMGDNNCATGYASTPATNFRCSTCAGGFAARGSACVSCPASPAGLLIGAIAIVLAVAAAGYFLNKRSVTIAVGAIGVDYFQVRGGSVMCTCVCVQCICT